MNKKGDIASIIWLVLIVFVAGVTLFIFSHVFYDLYGSFDEYFEDSDYNQSEAHTFIEDVQETESYIWDYVFLAVVMAYVISLFVTSFSTAISPIFYFIYAIMVMLGLFVGVVLSNLWQTIAATPELADTVARFPITDTILGNFYPLFIAFFAVSAMILLFGKNAGGER